MRIPHPFPFSSIILQILWQLLLTVIKQWRGGGALGNRRQYQQMLVPLCITTHNYSRGIEEVFNGTVSPCCLDSPRTPHFAAPPCLLGCPPVASPILTHQREDKLASGKKRKASECP